MRYLKINISRGVSSDTQLKKMDSKGVSRSEEFRAGVQLIATLSNVEKVNRLERISHHFCKDKTPPDMIVVTTTDYIDKLAEAMVENSDWVLQEPRWLADAVESIYYNMQWEIPLPQTNRLLEATKRYLLERDSGYFISLVHRIVTPLGNKQMVLADQEIYQHLKKVILARGKHKTVAVRCLQGAVLDSVEWQWRMLQDKEFILNLVACTDEADGATNDTTWSLLALTCQHHDAKSVFLPEVLERAKAKAKQAEVEGKTDCSTCAEETKYCINICSILCDEADALALKLSSTYVESRVNSLEELLAIKYDKGKVFRNSLLSLVLPFVNLSIADAAKKPLGKQLVSPLLRVLQITKDKPLISKIERCLDRSKQEASRALWHLAFCEDNLKLIEAEGGSYALKAVLEASNDTKVKHNVNGILYMLSQKHTARATTHKAASGHIMISYNWSNQQTARRLASSLEARGFKVWIDTEKMWGSTLEAMSLVAGAIEGAKVVLMCVSQKYKDSPNCRLEAEYCVKRSVLYIPLVMQKGYKADGWLGLILGAKMYYNFSSIDEWEAKVLDVIKELEQNGVNTTLNGISSSDTTIPVMSAQPAKKSAENWTENDISSWMQRTGIAEYQDLFISHKINGNALQELKEQLQNPNHNVLSFLRDGLSITKVGDVLAIAAAIRKL